mmetsp:Transcript_14645/g.37898  ORF Transcript_14645/g.37898 Transcript_14645/m.37898 type:complete len:215 (-) Transcript_14645:434-1078(-)
MNFELVELDVLHVEAYQIKEVLKVLLHSIIFQRALGECRYRDCESELFDLAYVQVDSRPISQRVEEYAEAFSSALERTEATRRAQIGVSFVERRSRPAAFGLFRSMDEKVTWERWNLTLSVRAPEAPPPPEVATADPAGIAEYRRRQQQQLGEELRGRLEVILSTAAARKEHLPPADGLAGDGTWFEVSSDTADSSLMDIFKIGFKRSPTLFTT